MRVRPVTKLCLGTLLAVLASAMFATSAFAAGTLVAEPDQVVFPDPLWGAQSSASVMVRNTGPDAVTLGDLVLGGDDVDAFDFAGGSCAPDLELAVGATCAVDLAFTPTWPEAGEQHDGTLVVEGGADDDPAVAQLYASFRDPYPARLLPSPYSLVLSAVPGTQSAATTVVMRNTGEQGLWFVSVTSSAAFPIVSNGCVGWLDAEDSCPVAIVFTPPAGVAPSTLTGTLRLRTEPVGAGFEVQLRGRTARAVVPRNRFAPTGPQPERPWRVYPWLDAALADLADAVPRLIRGGPARSRLLPAFAAPAAGRLSLTLFGWTRARRQRIGAGALRFAAAGSGRLRFKLNRKGVALLRRPQRTRTKVVLKFEPRHGASARQGPERMVKAPLEKRKRR